MDLLGKLGRLLAVPTTHVARYRCVDCGTRGEAEEDCPECGGHLEKAVETIPCTYWGQYH